MGRTDVGAAVGCRRGRSRTCRRRRREAAADEFVAVVDDADELPRVVDDEAGAERAMIGGEVLELVLQAAGEGDTAPAPLRRAARAVPRLLDAVGGAAPGHDPRAARADRDLVRRGARALALLGKPRSSRTARAHLPRNT